MNNAVFFSSYVRTDHCKSGHGATVLATRPWRPSHVVSVTGRYGQRHWRQQRICSDNNNGCEWRQHAVKRQRQPWHWWRVARLNVMILDLALWIFWVCNINKKMSCICVCQVNWFHTQLQFKNTYIFFYHPTHLLLNLWFNIIMVYCLN